MTTIQPSLNRTPAFTPKPLLRRPTLTRKREEDGLDTPSSPSKRVKVTFDSDVEVRVMNDWEKAPQLVQEEVRRAFTKRALGDDSEYEKLKSVYIKKTDEDGLGPKTMRKYMTALLGNISALNKANSDLVLTILSSEWLGRQDDYVTLYLRFLANLGSTHGMYLGDIMRMLIENLSASPPSNGRLPNLPPVTRSTIYARTHRAIQYLLQLIPAATRLLSSSLVSAFPHETDSRRSHVIYVQNLLKLVTYAPQFRAEILSLITERLVKIDVQVQVDLEDLAEDVGEGLVERIPTMRSDLMNDDEDSESSDNESELDDEEIDTDSQRTRYITRNVEKMDALLDILFANYNHVFTKGSEVDREGTVNILLSQFVTTVLPTQRSRHTQFLLFHFTQQSPTYIDTFVGTCVQMTFDKTQPAIIRQASAAYLASFVARGMHVPSNVVRDVFDYLRSELDRLRRQDEPDCRGPDMKRYSSFYVLVQALLYIFCFRWRDLQSSSEDDLEDDGLTPVYGHEHQWKYGVKEALSLNIFSKLNPLKVCSPAIVQEFAGIAHHLGVIYVYHLLETNKRVRLLHSSGQAYGGVNRQTALSARRDGSNQHLDEYFPFDPYHLPKSKQWIDGDYREWAGIPGLNDGQGSDSSSDEEDVLDSEVGLGMETDETSGS